MKKSDRIQQKRLRQKQCAFNLREKAITWLKSKNPILRFALGFALLMGIFYSFWFTDFFTTNILAPFAHINAMMAAKVLALFGHHPIVSESTLHSSSVTIDVGRGCDALEPIAIFVFAVLLFPASFKTKLYGICAVLPILFALNQVRIITLFLAGAYSDSWFGNDKEFYFNLLHLQIWPVIYIVTTLMLLAYWILFSLRNKKPEAHPSS